MTLTNTHTHAFGRISLDDGLAQRRNFYLTTHNTHNRQTHNPGKLVPTDAGFRLHVHRDRHKHTWCWSHFWKFNKGRLLSD